MTPPRVSVIVPTYAPGPELDHCLAAVAAQTARVAIADVVVVDDGSPAPVVLGPVDLPVQLLRQANLGPAAARNRALEVARGTLVWILNDDALPAPDCLDTLLRFYDRTAGCRSVLGAFDFLPTLLHDPFMRMVQQGTMMFAYDVMRNHAPHDWRYFWTCNILVDLAAVHEVGAFDADCFGTRWGAEDVELGYRLQHDLGILTYLCREAACGHDHLVADRQYFDRRVALGRNLFQMYAKHGDPRVIYLPGGAPYDARTHDMIGSRIAARQFTVNSLMACVQAVFDTPNWDRGRETALFPVLRSLCELAGQELTWQGIHSEACEMRGLTAAPSRSGRTVLSDFDLRAISLMRAAYEVQTAGPARIQVCDLGQRPIATPMDEA